MVPCPIGFRVQFDGVLGETEFVGNIERRAVVRITRESMEVRVRRVRGIARRMKDEQRRYSFPYNNHSLRRFHAL